MPSSVVFHRSLVNMLRDFDITKGESIMKGFVYVITQKITRHSCKNLKPITICCRDS
jgi:hypothetical protein